MKPRAFYNDNDSRVCAWVRELMADGLIMEGDVDERSIKEIQPEELAGYTRIHLFCGIAGWDHALQLADWPADRPVLTCSAPCQSFSCAGQGAGVNDPRHLWPEAFRIIRALKPECVIGEQVAAAIGHGWLDGICDDLEGEGYTTGAAVLGACSVGAPHIRQRLFWMAGARHAQRRQVYSTCDPEGRELLRRSREEVPIVTGERCQNSGLANSNGGESGERELQRGGGLVQQPQNEAAGGMEHTAGDGREQRRATSGERSTERGCGDSGVGNATGDEQWRIGESGEGHRREGEAGGSSAWDDYQLIPCLDGKARRIKSGLQPLAHGVPGRVGLLRGAGNAIVPQVAAEFIRAVMDLKGGENHAWEAKKEKVRRLLK